MKLEKLILNEYFEKTPRIIALLAGATKGYMDAKGIETSHLDNLAYLGIGPALNFTTSATFGYVANKDNKEEAIKYSRRFALAGTVMGIVQTGLGYCIGYIMGNADK